MTHTFEGRVEPYSEDGGCALSAELSDERQKMYIRLHSYDRTRTHPQLRPLEGKLVRVTIEVIEE